LTIHLTEKLKIWSPPSADHLKRAAIELRYLAGDLLNVADEIDQARLGAKQLTCKLSLFTGRMRWIVKEVLANSSSKSFTLSP
jgi:hypothetical protein